MKTPYQREGKTSTTGSDAARPARLCLAALLAALLLPASLPAFECPQKDSQEKAEDCPWAGAARLMAGKPDGALGKVFSAHAPGVLGQLAADKSSPGLLKLWGESINYDELANGEIVSPAILRFISARLGIQGPRGKIMHAGAEHTYGYLFSLLPTKFGFKRARWVRPDIEEGLGLPRGSAGPNPPEGTLLANITCLAGGIALKDDPAAWALLGKASASCQTGIKNFAFSGVRRVRLTEEVALPGGRTVALRTDLVPFRKQYGGNSHLLVYSVRDSAAKQARLITLFPVNQGFVDGVTAREGLGPDKPVQTRYNAHVDGLTGAGDFKGTRAVAELEK